MILLLLGTQKFKFNRLVKYMDDLIAQNKITEEVYGQIGYCSYIPKNFKYSRFFSPEEYSHYIDKSSTVVTHAGVGSILSSLKGGKKTIVVPRSERGEHVDNHQVQIAQKYAELGYVLTANTIDQLEAALNDTQFVSKYKPQTSCKDKICASIIDFIEKGEK